VTHLKVWAQTEFHLRAILIVHCGNQICCRTPSC